MKYFDKFQLLFFAEDQFMDTVVFKSELPQCIRYFLLLFISRFLSHTLANSGIKCV